MIRHATIDAAVAIANYNVPMALETEGTPRIPMNPDTTLSTDQIDY